MPVKFNVGDILVITRSGEHMYDYAGSWNPAMGKYTGQTVKVIEVMERGYRCKCDDGDDWIFDERCLAVPETAITSCEMSVSDLLSMD